MSLKILKISIYRTHEEELFEKILIILFGYNCFFRILCRITFNLFSSGKSGLILSRYMRSLPNSDLRKGC